MQDPAIATPESLPPVALAGAWRRIFAFLIDMVILGALGTLLGALFNEQFAALGAWGRAVGFVVALAYFGILDSHIGRGGSLGKRLLGLRVVTGTGAMLSAPAAFGRAAIFCLAYFLNGATIDTSGKEWVTVAQSLVISLLILAVFYLLLFNRRTRQSMHDLAVGAYVVKTGPGVFAAPAMRVWRGHFAVMGVAMLVLVGGSVWLAKQVKFAGLLTTQRAIAALPGVDRVSVNLNVFTSGKTVTHGLLIGAVVAASTPNPEALAAKIANVALSAYPEAGEEQQIVVTLSSGYDIGIASSWRWASYTHTPEQWRALRTTTHT